jgi:streptogramin lyase
MAVDRNDRVWTCYSTVARFDYPSQTWQTAAAGGPGGCMPDGGDLIWLANDPLVAVDIDTLAVMQTIDLPNYVRGVSIDFNGNVWGPAINNNEAYRVDPVTLRGGSEAQILEVARPGTCARAEATTPAASGVCSPNRCAACPGSRAGDP